MFYLEPDENNEPMPRTDPQETARRLGTALERLRAYRGFNKSAVARATGYTNTNYGLIEAGTNKEAPPLHRVLDLMQAMGVNPELFWLLLEGPTRAPARQGVDPEIEEQLNLSAALAEQITQMVADVRRRVQAPPGGQESPPEAP